MVKLNKDFCQTCGSKAHNFEKEEALDCVPPEDVLQFGKHVINKEYRIALYNEYHIYTAEEIVGSFLGHNPYFPSQHSWLEQNNQTPY